MQLESQLNDVAIGDYVEIITSNNEFYEGYVKLIAKPAKPGNVRVALDTGKIGKVKRIIPNKNEELEKRILIEDQYNENKPNFRQEYMKTDEIPHAVQSFLNSEGGYLNIGIKDDGPVADRFAGIEEDLKCSHNPESKTNDKLCDEYRSRIMDSLDKYLESDTALGPLVDITFVWIRNVQIARIRVKSSPKPWFFKHYNKTKPIYFDVKFGKFSTKRKLDDFYVRSGPRRAQLETMSDFYQYAKDHWNLIEVEKHD